METNATDVSNCVDALASNEIAVAGDGSISIVFDIAAYTTTAVAS